MAYKGFCDNSLRNENSPWCLRRGECNPTDPFRWTDLAMRRDAALWYTIRIASVVRPPCMQNRPTSTPLAPGRITTKLARQHITPPRKCFQSRLMGPHICYFCCPPSVVTLNGTPPSAYPSRHQGHPTWRGYLVIKFPNF